MVISVKIWQQSYKVKGNDLIEVVCKLTRLCPHLCLLTDWLNHSPDPHCTCLNVSKRSWILMTMSMGGLCCTIQAAFDSRFRFGGFTMSKHEANLNMSCTTLPRAVLTVPSQTRHFWHLPLSNYLHLWQWVLKAKHRSSGMMAFAFLSFMSHVRGCREEKKKSSSKFGAHEASLIFRTAVIVMVVVSIAPGDFDCL